MNKKILVISLPLFLYATLALAGQGTLNVKVLPPPPELSATVEFDEPSGNRKLDPEETGKLVIAVKNNGKGDAFDVKAEIQADISVSGLSLERSLTIGTIAPGQSVRKELALKASEDIPTGDVNLTIIFREANGFDPDPLKIAFETKAFEPPRLIIADVGMDKPRVRPGETVETTVRIQNAGYGDAKAVSVDIEPGENVFLAGDSMTHFDLGDLSTGKFKDVKFEFYTNRRIRNGEKVPITVKIGEERPRFGTAKPLDIVMDATQRQIKMVVVKGDDDRPRGAIEIAGGLSVDVETQIPEGEKAGKFDVAVVIGNRNYAASGSPDVEFADRDARIVKEYLIKTFGYEPENIIYAEDASFAKFNEIFGSAQEHRGRLYKYVKAGISRVFVYYVGHGAPDLDTGDAYFVPVDANPQFISTNGYRLQTFYNNLSKIPAKKITVVLDTCFSGNSGKGMLFKNISPSLVKVKKEYQGPKNTNIITSAAPDQVSAWYPDKKHSLFTYYFLKAVQGEADANRDKRITIGEIGAYLKDNVPYMAQRLSGTEQQPVVSGSDTDVVVVLK